MASPTMTHYHAKVRALRYLNGSPGRRILFLHNSSFQVLGFSDTKGGECSDTRRFVTNFFFSRVIRWNCGAPKNRPPSLNPCQKQSTGPWLQRCVSYNDLCTSSVTNTSLTWSPSCSIMTIKVRCTLPWILFSTNAQSTLISINTLSTRNPRLAWCVSFHYHLLLILQTYSPEGLLPPSCAAFFPSWGWKTSFNLQLGGVTK